MSYDVADRIIARRRTRWEEERKKVLREVLSALDRVAGKYGVQQAIIFGSLAREGRFRPESDIDLAVPRLSARDFFRFGSEMTALVGREVEVAELGALHFREWVETEGVRWKRRDTGS